MDIDQQTRWNQRYASTELIWSAGPNELFAEIAAGLAIGSALDLGCGEGRNSIWLAQQGWRVSAVDFAANGLDKGRELSSQQGLDVEWILADVSQWESDVKYDLVAVLFLHTSKREREHWLTMAVQAVQPGGYFLYIGHDPENIANGSGGPQIPDVLVKLSELEECCGNFDHIRAETFSRTLLNEEGHGGVLGGKNVALDTIFLAKRKY